MQAQREAGLVRARAKKSTAPPLGLQGRFMSDGTAPGHLSGQAARQNKTDVLETVPATHFPPPGPRCSGTVFGLADYPDVPSPCRSAHT